MNAIPDDVPASAAFAAEYARALGEVLRDRSESGLAAAYRCGRIALDQGRTIPEIVELHHRLLVAWCAEHGVPPSSALIEASGRFLAEFLAPYEMARRGVHDAVRALRRLNESLEHEVQRIAHAVHDEAGQLAAVLHLSLAELARTLPGDAGAALQPVRATLDLVERQLRQVSHELRPSLLDDLGWLPAIRWLAQSVADRGALAVEVRAPVELRLPPAVEIALYRVIQEALSNVTRHAAASRVTITAAVRERRLEVEVRDDGIGFDVAAVQRPGTDRGLGLLGMQERLAAVGGDLVVKSIPGQGTRIRITVPQEACHGAEADTG